MSSCSASLVESLVVLALQRANDLAERHPRNNILTSTGRPLSVFSMSNVRLTLVKKPIWKTYLSVCRAIVANFNILLSLIICWVTKTNEWPA